MKILETHISTKWLKASVMGSIWAANEIILGSFLHNLRVPLSGTFMAFLSVALMVAFSVLWKERGIIIRAGLVAALMKSISPSAIILGPMVGIFLEALLLQLWVWLLGRNLAGFMLGGAFAVGVVVFQKIGRLLISYGFDFIIILNNLFSYAVRELHLQEVSAGAAVGILVSFYVFWGLVAAVLGWFAGRKALKRKTASLELKIDLKRGGLYEKSDKRKYSVALLFLHLLVLISAMALINSRHLLAAGLVAMVYVAFVIWRYRSALRRLRKPGFWLWFVAITFLAAWFLDPASDGPGLSRQGLVAGLLMNLRAFLVLFSFAAISIELRNPLIKAVMFRHGAASLYRSLEVSFSILPVVTGFFPPAKQLARQPLTGIISLLNKADVILQYISNNYNHKTPVLIVTGEVQTGKTSFLKEMYKKLIDSGVSVGGFVTLVEYRDHKRKAYYLSNLHGGEPVLFCSVDPSTGTEHYGRFYFNEKAFERGKEILRTTLHRGDAVLIVDEVGPLEMSDKGWAPELEKVLQTEGRVMVWAVRKSLAAKAARKWDTGTVAILNIDEEQALQQALSFVLKHT